MGNGTEAVVVYSDGMVTFALVVCVILVLIGVVGNLLTVGGILVTGKLRGSATSWFIVSLSGTDLLFCAVNLPIQAVRWAHKAWVLGSALCQVFPFLFYLNVAASLFSMCAVTLNRYVLIAHYTRYDRLYKPRAVAAMIGFCWAVPAALLLPTLAGSWGRFGYRAETFSCTVLPGPTGASPKKLFFLIGFFLPVVVMGLCHARIGWIVRRSRRALGSARSGASAAKESLTLTKMVAIIFAVFLASYLPLFIANVVDEHDRYPDLHVLASLLAYGASVWNPAIYGLMSSRYRDAYRNVLRLLCRRQATSPGDLPTQVTSSSLGALGRSGRLQLSSVRLSDSFHHISTAAPNRV